MSIYSGCNLTSIVLPSKIEKIGESAFSGCNINSIEFPASLKYIDNAAFGLFEEIHVKSNLPVNCNLWAFGFAEECVLYVPKGAKSIYQANSFWGQCKNIVEVSL